MLPCCQYCVTSAVSCLCKQIAADFVSTVKKSFFLKAFCFCFINSFVIFDVHNVKVGFIFLYFTIFSTYNLYCLQWWGVTMPYISYTVRVLYCRTYNIPHCLTLCLSCCIITVLPVPDIYIMTNIPGKLSVCCFSTNFIYAHVVICYMQSFSFVDCWRTPNSDVSLVGWLVMFLLSIYFCYVAMLPWLRHLSVAMVLDSCHVCQQIASTNVSSELFHLLCCTLSVVSILYFQLIVFPLSVCT